jgi:DHA1 family bicyclomycin/chloramphenicol resistance-like MFS transporter
VLLVGVSLYIVAGIASATAPSIGWLIAARALQGAGMAAAVMCGRAMVRDLYEPHDGMRVMSQALSGLGIIALAAPVVGGLIAASFGWRMALLATAVFGAGALALLALRVPETARNLNPEATRIGPLIATYWRIARNPTFLAWSLLVTATYAGIYAFLGGSTFVYVNEMGASRRVVGLLIALASVSYLVGTIVCRRWLVSLGARGAVRRAALLTAAAAALHAGFALQDAHTLWTLSLAQVLYGFGHGIHQPCGQAGVVGPFPREAGAASALAGFMLALGAFLMGGWLGATLDGGVRVLFAHHRRDGPADQHHRVDPGAAAR